MHDTDQNLPVTVIRNWNITNAIKSVAEILNSIQVGVNVLSKEALSVVYVNKKMKRPGQQSLERPRETKDFPSTFQTVSVNTSLWAI